MNDRGGLIERAAARLSDAKTSATLPEGATILSPRAAAKTTALPSLQRSLVLDRAKLAQYGIIMPSTGASRIVEEFRIIKRNLMTGWQSPEFQRNAPNGSARTLMVTSARPREGKTFSAINLALSFSAEHNFVVILIDADTTRHDVANIVGTPIEPGLTEVLSGTARLLDTLVQTDIENFIILPPGAGGPNVPELISSDATGRMFTELASRYPSHLIVIDAAPCLASSDPATFASQVSQIIFIVEAGHTQQAEVESSLNLISSCPFISLLLNKSAVDAGDHFGSYSGYFESEQH